jgi:hypothetical protein
LPIAARLLVSLLYAAQTTDQSIEKQLPIVRGVEPDVKAEAADALATAERLARGELQRSSRN